MKRVDGTLEAHKNYRTDYGGFGLLRSGGFILWNLHMVDDGRQ